MWFLFQIAIMTLIIGSNSAYHWAGETALPSLYLQLSPRAGCLLNDLFQWMRRKRG
jgi:hypothetical protein